MKPVLFLAFANDRGGTFLRSLAQELTQLKEALLDEQGLRERGEPRWLVHDVVDTTVDDVVRALQGHRDRIALIHYGGHAGDFALLLQSADGAPVVAHAGGLARLLGGQRGLQCVFLNGCSTRGHVRDLLAAGVPAVIATRHPVEDEMALAFARHFYGGLATGASLGRAFDDAEAALRTVVGGAPNGTAARDLDLGNEPPRLDDDRIPWELHVADGADVVREWSLGAAAGDPLFGLPPLPERPLPPSPFRHLRWFTCDDAELFFGRGREIHALHESVTAASAAPVTLLYGQSGAGKSSLLDAGLRPRLADAYDVRYARRDERLGLTGTLRALLGTPYGASLADAWRAREADAGRPVVAIVDQVEEAFTRPGVGNASGELADFADALGTLFRGAPPAARLVLGFRKEWLAEIARRLAESRVPYQEVFLDRLGRAGIVDAVTGPATVPRLRRHYAFEIDRGDELATVIADDLLAHRDSAVAPTLQVLLSKMWDDARDARARRAGRVVFDTALYQRLARAGILLGDFVDEQLAALGAWNAGVVASGLALDVLYAHTTPLATARACAAAELARDYAHLGDVLPQLVERCRALYLLLDAPDGDGATTLAHDTLAPLVRHRFDASVLPGQRARRVLDARAGEWADGAVGRTLDAADLAQVEAGRAGMRAWTADEERLVAASRVACDAEARARRWRRRATVGGSVLVAALGIVAGVAGLSARRTSHRARVAAIVSAAASQRDPVDAALLLATLAGEPEPSGALQAALSIAAAPIPTVVTGTGEPLAGALFADGGRVVVAVPSSATGLPSVWRLDVSTGARGAGVSLGSPGVPAQLLAVSHDGRRVLFIGPDSGAGPTARETLYVRDALTGRVVARILDGPCSSPLNRLSAGFTRGGDVWSACADGELGLWRVGSTATVLPTRALGDSIAAVDVSPDGRLVAIGRRDGRIEISHVASDTALVVQDGRRAPSAIRFTADGSQVVVLQPDSMIVRYSTTAYELRPPLWSLPARILDFALSPDGRAVVAMEWGNVAHVLVDSIEAPALPHADRLLAVDFTADGRSVVTMAEGGRARVWPVVGPRAARLLPGEQGAWTVAFSADGRRVFSAGSFVAMVQNADGSGEPLVIRNPGPERVAGVLNAFAGVGFTADGRVLTLARDDAIRQWSAERVGVPPLVMSVASPAVDPDDRIIVAAAFSGDGRTVATLSHGNGPLRVRSVDGFGDTLSVPHGRRTRVVALSHDGRTLLLDDTDSAGRPVLRLRRPDGRWRTLALSDPPTRVAFGADAATVLATVGPGAIVWHPDSARATVLSDDAQGMVAVESSMDGQSLVTVSRDGTVRLRRVGGSALVLSPPDGASAAAFSSDGSRIATAGDAGVHVWPLRWPELVAELARSTTACLAEDKRRIYLAESVDDAHAAWLACERAHGRGREPAVRPP